MKCLLSFFLVMTHAITTHANPLPKYQQLLPSTHNRNYSMKIINSLKTNYSNQPESHTRLSFHPQSPYSGPWDHRTLHVWKENNDTYVMEQTTTGIIHVFITKTVSSKPFSKNE